MTPRDKAYKLYADRQSRRSRPKTIKVRQNGHIEQLYEPAEDEWRPCCDDVKHVLDHLRSAKHVANLFGLDAEEFVNYVRTRRKRETRAKRCRR